MPDGRVLAGAFIGIGAPSGWYYEIAERVVSTPPWP